MKKKCQNPTFYIPKNILTKALLVLISLLFMIENSQGQIKESEILNKSERFHTGWKILKKIDGNAGEAVIESLKDISPDLGNFIIEYVFGDIYSRDGLDSKEKEIAVVAALTAMGTAQPQLKVHLNGALNTGNSINEIKEVILQMSVYSGFPSSINAMNIFKEVINERKGQGINDNAGNLSSEVNNYRFERGVALLSKLDSEQVEKLKSAYNNFSPSLTNYIVEYAYGDIISRDNLNIKQRQIATIAALAALGNAESQLKFHINAGLNVGLTIGNINEIMLLMTVYAGFPAAINGTNILKEVVNERNQ